MNSLKLNISLIALALTLSGCSVQTEQLSLPEQVQLLEQDSGKLFAVSEYEVIEPLSMHDAVARALKNNLDYKVALLEEEIKNKKAEIDVYDALPEVELSGDFNHRTNDRASSSQSVSSGLQSLESSYSSDRSIRNASLRANWDLINSGIAISQARNTSDEGKIAFERRRKMLQTIVREVHTLYWRAASAQLLQEKIGRIVTSAKANIEQLEGAQKLGVIPKDRALHQRLQLSKSINELLKVREDMSSAKYELSSLINVSPLANYTLKVDRNDFYQRPPQIEVSSKDLSTIALVYRPESREEVLKNRIMDRADEQEILNTVPGLDLFISGNYDSNSFLLNPTWVELGAKVSQSLVKLLTLPQRLESVKLEKAMSDIRRQALLSAIVTQTHIANEAYRLSNELYSSQSELHQIEKSIFESAYSKYNINVLSESEYIEIQIDTLLGEINFHNSYIDLWHSYIMLIDTLGVDPLPHEMAQASNHSELKKALHDRHIGMTNEQFSYAANTIYQNSSVLNPSNSQENLSDDNDLPDDSTKDDARALGMLGYKSEIDIFNLFTDMVPHGIQEPE